MKATIIIAALLTLSAAASADQVRGYFRQNGTYVQPHFRSTPNATPFDNYSTRGNINPYTGSRGYVSPYSYRAPSQRSIYRNPYTYGR